VTWSAESVLFVAFGALTLLSAVVVVVARNPISSAMALVGTFFFLAGLYVMLLAHTIAVLQVLVYAGAVMVLFLFVIMLLSLGGNEPHSKATAMRVIGGVASGGLLAVLVAVIRRIPEHPAVNDPTKLNGFGGMHTVGELLYTTWLFPFEAVSLLLLVAIVGAVVVAKSRI
jgi:NADH-quinone oxidoreductase subunit J